MIRSIFELSLKEEITIRSSVEDVWDTLTSLDSWPAWNEVCRKASWVSGDTWTIGSVFSMELILAGVSLPFTVAVNKYEKPKELSWSSTFLGITGTREFKVEKVSRNIVRVTDSKIFTSSFLPIKLFYPRPIINKMSRGWLNSLKTRSELKD